MTRIHLAFIALYALSGGIATASPAHASGPAYKYRIKPNAPIIEACPEGKSRAKAEIGTKRADGTRDILLVLRFCTQYGFRKMAIESRVKEIPASANQIILIPVSQDARKLPELEVTLADLATLAEIPGWSPGMLPWKNFLVRASHPLLNRPLVIDGELYRVENED